MSPAVHIRPVQASDEAAYLRAARRSRRLHRPWVTAPCDADAFRSYVARFDGVQHFGFLVVDGATQEPAGAIHLTNVVYGVFRSGYLGYFAFAGFEGRGLMTRGLKLVAAHAFRELKLHRLEANIQPANAASIALVRRCGFVREGYSPAYLKLGGRWRDHERWALVKGRRPAA